MRLNRKTDVVRASDASKALHDASPGGIQTQVMGTHKFRWAPVTLATILCFTSLQSKAAYQRDEDISDAVRTALSHAITDPNPPKSQFPDIDERIKYLHWLGEMSDRIKKALPDDQLRLEFLQTAWYESRRAGLDPALVLGLIQVESAFHGNAQSNVGARGYMQVMPFWTRVIGDGDAKKLFQLQINLRYGCSILRTYIDREAGNLFLALGRYNGSRGRPEYPNAVLAAWKRWEYKS